MNTGTESQNTRPGTKRKCIKMYENVNKSNEMVMVKRNKVGKRSH